MAKVVNSWAFSSAAMRNACTPQKPAEVFVYILNRHRFTIQCREKIIFCYRKRMHLFRIIPTAFRKRNRHGYQPAVVFFGMMDGENDILKVNVCYFEKPG